MHFKSFILRIRNTHTYAHIYQYYVFVIPDGNTHTYAHIYLYSIRQIKMIIIVVTTIVDHNLKLKHVNIILLMKV